MKTPVIFIIFNRPNQTQLVFDTIKAAKPEKLLVIADGPRNEKEREKTDATRAIIDTVDWKCEVIKYYSDTNVGVKKFLPAGLIWAFNQVDRGIVFEADCLPHPSFFPFCEELLEKYKDDERVMHIGGNFFQHRNPAFDASPSSHNSYYFSNIPHIWGWATWSRAWKHYDPDLKLWPQVKKEGTLRTKFQKSAEYEYWETVWDQYYNKQLESWDGQWVFACLHNNGLSITPTVNLVSNIGFGPDAIHSIDPNSIFANIPTQAVQLPLTHPKDMRPDDKADAFTWRQNFGIDAKLRQRVLGPFRRNFPRTYAAIRNLIKRT